MKISPALLTPLMSGFYRLWCSTLRVSEEGRERIAQLESSGGLIMFSIWHDELFPLTYVRKKIRLATIVSQSSDGEYLARLQESLGIVAVRGSSSRGGLKALLQTASLMQRDRYHCCITLDGPRGPRHVAKPGAVILAFRVGAWLMPVRVFMKRRKCFRSWDRFQLPWPFSRIHVVWGEPYQVAITDLSEASLKQETARLERRLNTLSPPANF